MRKVKISRLPKNAGGNQIGKSFIPNELGEPSIDVRKKLNGVPAHLANVEAEKGETVYLPDIGGLPASYEIGGDRHYDGGTPLLLPDESFVFSDTKSLKIKDPKILKEFGETGKKAMTPAKIDKKYKINEYRKILEDPTSDKIQRETAEKMISNYNIKKGKLALVQESMKGFPKGIPAISMPYLEAAGVDPSAVFPFSAAGTPEMNNMQFMQTGGIMSGADDYNYDIIPKDPKKLPYYKLDSNNLPDRYKDYGAWTNKVNTFFTNQENSAVAAKALQSYLNSGEYNRAVGTKLKNAKNTTELLKIAQEEATDGKPGPFHDLINSIIDNVVAQKKQGKPQEKVKEAPLGDVKTNDIQFSPKYFDSGFAPWWLQDTINSFGAIGDYFSARKYLPWAPQINPYLPTPTFKDPTRELAANAEQANIASNALGAFSGPQALSSRLSSVQGQAGKNAADILARYNNDNVQIANTFESQKAEILNKYGLTNAAMATDLYDKTTIANQQWDNTKRQLRAEMRKQLVSGITNAQKTDTINKVYGDHFSIDPTFGGNVNFLQGEKLTGNVAKEQIEQFADNYKAIRNILGPDASSKDIAAVMKMFQGKDKKPNNEYLDSLLSMMGIM